MSCGLDTYRRSVGSFAFVLDKILHRKLASRRLHFLRSGSVMARFTVVNLILALLLRAGVEPNPGPNSRPASVTHDWTARTTHSVLRLFDSLTAAHLTNSNYGHIAQLPSAPPTAPSLLDRDVSTTSLSNTVHRLENWRSSLQVANDQFQQDVRYLSQKCELFDGQCANFYDWKDHFVKMCLNIPKEMDKLESFSRRNNVRFFNVYEGSNEEKAACVSKVLQLLNRFYSSSKTWTADDVERAHRTGPKNDNYNRPRPIVALLHRWQDKLTVLQQRDGKKQMADTLNIRVASDLTGRQSSVLRQERSAGRRAYSRNGRLHYNNRPPPRNRRTPPRTPDSPSAENREPPLSTSLTPTTRAHSCLSRGGGHKKTTGDHPPTTKGTTTTTLC